MLQRAPPWWNLFQIKYSFEKFRDSEAMQEYNSILYSYVALSIKGSQQQLILYKFDCLPVLVIATEYPASTFGFVQCKYIWFPW